MRPPSRPGSKKEDQTADEACGESRPAFPKTLLSEGPEVGFALNPTTLA